MFSLKDKVAIVTGSTRGIGRSIAEQLAAAGARVVISSRKAQACEATLQEFRERGDEAIALPCNVGHKDELRALVDETLAQWGKIDILVCNAASNPVFGPLLEVPDDAFDKVMLTNVKSVFWLANLALPHIAAQGGGAVIVISSIGALRGSDVMGLYGTSKAAEIGLVRALAVEWGPKNVRVNAIAPGLVMTDFARALWQDPQRRARREQATPLRRLGQPKDIGGVAVFLASEAGAFVTGQVIVADGGVTIAP